jgi:hypothetical protein
MMTTINNRYETIAIIMTDHQGETTTIIGLLLVVEEMITTVETTTTMTGQTTTGTTIDLLHVVDIIETMTFTDLLTTTIQVQDHHNNKIEDIEDKNMRTTNVGQTTHVIVVQGKTRMMKEATEDKRTTIIAVGAAAVMSTGVIIIIMIAEGYRHETTASLEDTTTMNSKKITATKTTKTKTLWRLRPVISFPSVGALKLGRRYKAGAYRRQLVSSVCGAWYAWMMQIWSCVQVASLSLQSKEEVVVVVVASVSV